MITVLRLGERPERDHRINTHLALVARAFGADKLIMFFRDPSLLSSISSVNDSFGGDFRVDIAEGNSWRTIIRGFEGVIVHLTMYGIALDEGLTRLQMEGDEKDLLIIVGGEKVPAEIYQRSHLNVSIGNQPHSEVAALAVFLNRYFLARNLKFELKGWKKKIIPTEQGKRMISQDQ